MFPGEFIKRLRNQEYLDAGSLLRSLSEPAPVSIRINPGKWDRVPAGAEQVQWCTTGYYLQRRPSFTLDPLFHSGCYYPREASGMFMEQVLRQLVPPGDLRVLDLCGAPGGKSTQIADLIGRESVLIANEVIRQRAYVLSETLTKWGNPNVIVTQNDPAVFGRMQGYFDIIVIDAPCSGEGMFRDPVAVREWSPEHADHCAARQKRILMDVWPALKTGGLLVYSTCTFNPGENEENIRWLTGQDKAECLRLDITGFEGVTEIDLEGVYGYGFYPGRTRGEGFFISAVRKTDRAEKHTPRPQRRSEFIPDKKEIQIAVEWTSFPASNLVRQADEITGLACSMGEYLYLFGNLNIIKAGTKIFSAKKNDLIPAHDLTLSGNLRKGAFPARDMTAAEAVSYLRRDVLSLDDLRNGWNIVTHSGTGLGFVKNIGKRVNNYYPVEWRIRMTPSGDEETIKWQ